MQFVNESSIFRMFNKNLIGTRLLISKLKEKPFFVETNPISAEPTSDPYYWKFSSNPLVCNVYDESLEKISIFLLHCAHYCIKDNMHDFALSEFPKLLHAYCQLLNRIYVELNRTTEFESIASAFNLIVIMKEIFDIYPPSILLKQNSNAVLYICENIKILKKKCKSVYTVDHHQLSEIFESALLNLYVEFKNAVDLTNHNDLRFETLILTDEEDLYIFRSDDEFWHNVEDNYYHYATSTIQICDESDLVEISRWSTSYYPEIKKYEELTDYPHYTSPDELFSLCEENSLNSKENVNILKHISHLRRNAHDALLMTNVEFFQLVSTFAVNFFNRKNRRDYKNEIVILNENEMLFLFEFFTELIMTLNEFLLWSGKILENLIPAVLRKLTKVMNSVKFQEILNVVTDHHAYHAVASLNSLIDNPNIVTILPQTPGNLLLILTKIYNMVCEENNQDTRDLRENDGTEIYLFPVKYIHSPENIPKRRRSIWKKLLVKGSTAQSCLERFQGDCTICLNNMDPSSTYSLLVCGHAFCYTCLDSLLENESFFLFSSFCCPNCRVSCRDVVISSSIEKICNGLENL